MTTKRKAKKKNSPLLTHLLCFAGGVAAGLQILGK